jgi:hypothetical protein
VRTRAWLTAVVSAAALAGCTPSDTADAPTLPSTATEQRAAGDESQPTDEPSDELLDGRSPCDVLDRDDVGLVTQTEVVTAESQQGVVGCVYNEAQQGITSAVYFYPAGEVTLDKPAPGREGWTTAAVTVPGAAVAWLRTSEQPGKPAAEVCTTARVLTSCGYTTAPGSVPLDALATMAAGLARLLVERVG